MVKLSPEARVGLALLTGILILAVMTFTVGGYRFGTQGGYRIIAVFESAAGLDTKSSIKVAGVEVGKVEAIALADDKARVTLRIRPGVKLRKGTQTALRATGLLGEKYVELLPGTEEGYLKEGDVLPESQKAADLDKLITQFSDIAGDIKTVSVSLREALGSEEGKASLKKIVANVRDVTQSLKDDLPKLLASLNSASEKLETIAIKVERGEGTLGKLVNDEDVYKNLDEALENLNTITRRVERGEGTIGKLFSDEKAYDQINTALEGLSNAVSRIERFRTTVGLRTEYQFESDEFKGYFSLQLQPREDKFYLIELVDDPRGIVTETITQTPPGPPVVEFKTRHRLKFSALFGRRFSDVALRIGLMENSFGFGTDYYLFDNRLKFSLDAWDFSSEDPLNEKAHLKATASLAFFRFLFVHGGYDNFINRDIDTTFVGGGIRLDDDDLKYLVGSGTLRIR